MNMSILRKILRKLENILCKGFSYVFNVHVGNFCTRIYGKIKWYANVRGMKYCAEGNYCVPPYVFVGKGYLSIGKGFRAKSHLRVEAYKDLEQEPVIIIGESVCFNYNVHIGAINRIEIGNRVLVGSNVLITDHDHGDTRKESLLVPPIERPHVSKGSVLIGDDVWIGENVSILAGSTIGKGCVIGANSVIRGERIPDYCVVVGNPARIIQR